MFQYDTHPIVTKPDYADSPQYTPVNDDMAVVGEMFFGSENSKQFHNMTDDEKQNFIDTSY